MWTIVKTLLFGNPVPGYPSLLVVILFLGGVQLLALGILGEYVGRMFDESKGRPLYLVNQYMHAMFDTPSSNDPALSSSSELTRASR
jgi:hypothetical protein